jgi:DNA polymerase-3 subunit alpha
VKYGNYGFNKSHAVVRATLAYQIAYLKANHPAEYLSATTDASADAELRHDPARGRLPP